MLEHAWLYLNYLSKKKKKKRFPWTRTWFKKHHINLSFSRIFFWRVDNFIYFLTSESGVIDAENKMESWWCTLDIIERCSKLKNKGNNYLFSPRWISLSQVAFTKKTILHFVHWYLVIFLCWQVEKNGINLSINLSEIGINDIIVFNLSHFIYWILMGNIYILYFVRETDIKIK